MAPETYYFFLSIIAVFAACLYVIHAAYYRVKGKTLIGNAYKPGTIEYERLRRFSSNRSLVIGGIVVILSAGNLFFDVYRLLHLSNQEYAHFMLIFAPVSITVIGVAVIIKIRSQFGKGKYKKVLNKHDRDSDSWLS